jgi:hypothetical protein
MINCKDCKHFYTNDTSGIGVCTIKLPPQIFIIFQDNSVSKDDGCDLGEPKEEETK